MEKVARAVKKEFLPFLLVCLIQNNYFCLQFK